ncbi:MAG: DUF4390 domain-containing protein [Pseudomonadota bacterium]
MKSKRLEALLRQFFVFLLCVVFAGVLRPATAAELTQLKVERGDDGVYLSAIVQFDIPPVIEDALLKGIPMFFVVEADVYQSRWYWTDRRVASATRTIRLAFQPLTRRWRVNIVSGLINGSSGLRATLNQNYESLPEALSAVQRLSRWRIGDNADIDPDVVHKLDFNFRLDVSQLPRPFQIGIVGQRDWTIGVQASERLLLAPLKASPVPPTAADK